jgi:hypothetical protein
LTLLRSPSPFVPSPTPLSRPGVTEDEPPGEGMRLSDRGSEGLPHTATSCGARSIHNSFLGRFQGLDLVGAIPWERHPCRDPIGARSPSHRILGLKAPPTADGVALPFLCERHPCRDAHRGWKAPPLQASRLRSGRPVGGCYCCRRKQSPARMPQASDR